MKSIQILIRMLKIPGFYPNAQTREYVIKVIEQKKKQNGYRTKKRTQLKLDL